MGLEKSFLIGEALSKAVEADGSELSIIDRPPGAINTFIGMGVVAQVMEEEPSPEVLSELRSRIDLKVLPQQYREFASRAVIHLLDDGVLTLNSERQLSFNPPNSAEYCELLQLPD